MARTGEWEAAGVRIIRIGSCYKVGVPSILEVLGYSDATHHTYRDQASGRHRSTGTRG